MAQAQVNIEILNFTFNFGCNLRPIKHETLVTSIANNLEKVKHMCNVLEESMTKATEEVLPKAKRKVKQTLMTEKIFKKISERKKMKIVSLEKYENINKEIAKECRKG